MKVVPLVLALALPALALADPARIEGVSARAGSDGWTFSVTLRHGDTEDDWANAWRVESADGEVLGTRTLFHSHINEQPFTRSQSGIAIPPDMKQVMVRSSTTIDGWADDTSSFDLPLEPEG